MELFGVTVWQKKTSSRVLGSRWVSGDMPQELEEEQGQLAGLPREKLLQALRALVQAPDSIPKSPKPSV